MIEKKINMRILEIMEYGQCTGKLTYGIAYLDLVLEKMARPAAFVA